ncbi:MAG: PaaI family thioesterase [Candidatus Hydrogenedentes bacterium]|nr:PaaI family thioesterase [Candidatus Hydrogenedentota bacterium]
MSSSENSPVYLPNSRSCFVCGEENIAGLQLRFFVEDDKIKTWFEPKAHHCGYPNVLHGGVVAALLDETIAWAANRALARMTVTAELKLRYRKPVPGDRRMLVWAEITKSSRRIAYGIGALVDESGEEFARAEGSFIPLSAEQTLAIDDHLIYRGGEERVFDILRNSP